MKLGVFSKKGFDEKSVGVLVGDKVIDICRVAKRCNGFVPFQGAAIEVWLELGLEVRKNLEQLVEKATDDEKVALGEIVLHAPITTPRRNVFCVGRNYEDHYKEGDSVRKKGDGMHNHPSFFSKTDTSLIGPYDPILYDSNVSMQMDWEVELAVIIGKTGKNINAADWEQYVFGYTVFNDVSLRDIQRKHGNQFLRGKSIDQTSPFGPWIVLAGDLDVYNLKIETRVNNVVKQSGTTLDMYFKIDRLLEELSLGLTVRAADMIATGTPAGVGWVRNPPEFLKPGDILETEVEGIGCMRNEVVSQT